VNEVEHERNAFWNFWYGREMIMIKGYLLGGGNNGSRRDSGTEKNSTGATSVTSTTTDANSSQDTGDASKATNELSGVGATAPMLEKGNAIAVEQTNPSATVQTGHDASTARAVSGEPIEKVVGKGGPKRGQGSQGGVT
jgi:hypothetical protein